jgi:hypothetical protein
MSPWTRPGNSEFVEGFPARLTVKFRTADNPYEQTPTSLKPVSGQLPICRPTARNSKRPREAASGRVIGIADTNLTSHSQSESPVGCQSGARDVASIV